MRYLYRRLLRRKGNETPLSSCQYRRFTISFLMTDLIYRPTYHVLRRPLSNILHRRGYDAQLV
jgi:hypothetical protein